MLPLCLLLLAARVGVLAELQTEEAACSSEPCEKVNLPMCGFDQTNNLKVYFLNECVFNCSNCLYRKAGSEAKFVKINTDECLNDSSSVFIHECPSSASDGAAQLDPAGSFMPFPMMPGPVMFGDANRGQEGAPMRPFLPDMYSSPQWMGSDPGTPFFSSPIPPGSPDNDMSDIPSIEDIDQNEISDTGDSNSDDSADFGFIAPSFSPYMVPMFNDKVSVNDDSDGMAPSPIPELNDQSALSDSSGSIYDQPALMLAPENALQYLPGDSPQETSDDDILSDGILSMMDDSPNNDLGQTFPEFQIGPVGEPLLSTDDDIVGDSGILDDFLYSYPNEEDSGSDVFAPDDTILFVPSDSSDDSGSEDDLLDIISSILQEDSSDDADTNSNPEQSIPYSPDGSSYVISVDVTDDGETSENDSPSSDIAFIPQDILVPLSDDTEVNPKDLGLPLSEGGMGGDQGTGDDVMLLVMDPLSENTGDDDAVSDTAADEGSDVLIFIPDEVSSAGSDYSDDSDLLQMSGSNDAPLIQEINFIPAQSESRGSSGGFSNLLESLLMQKLLFNSDRNGESSKQGNTYIDAKFHVEVNVQGDGEGKPSRNQHHPRYWNDDREGFPKRPKIPGYGLRDNDVDYTPAARQAALVMTTIGKTASSSSVINTSSVLLPILVSFFVFTL